MDRIGLTFEEYAELKVRPRVGADAALLLGGCGVRTVYVPHGTPVRLRETVEGVKVWVKDADGETVAGRMDLHEGWYCLELERE